MQKYACLLLKWERENTHHQKKSTRVKRERSATGITKAPSRRNAITPSYKLVASRMAWHANGMSAYTCTMACSDYSINASPTPYLVLGAVSLSRPLLEGLDGIAIVHLLARDLSLGHRDSELLINEVIVEVNVSRVLTRVGEEDAVGAGPVDGGEAHRAGLAAGVDGAPSQLKGLKRRAGVADGDNLGVGSGIIVAKDRVDASGDDLVIANNNAAEGATEASAHVVEGEVDGLAHKRLVLLGGGNDLSLGGALGRGSGVGDISGGHVAEDGKC